MANERVIELHEEALQRLLRGQMAISRISAESACNKMKEPMSPSALYDKLRKPGRFRVDELFDLCRALGIDKETLTENI